jgi:murein L,D-transpeptidase YcbB/YkuD
MVDVVPAPGRPRMTRRARTMFLALGAAVLVALPAAPSSAADDPPPTLRMEIADRAGGELRGFYAARGNKPLWLSSGGQLSPAAYILVRQIEGARADGLKPGKLKAGSLMKALDRARRGNADDMAKAELALSAGYVRYVQALRGARRADMIYESPALAPVVPSISAALQAAADAKSLEEHVSAMGWMHPLYAPLREALASGRYDERERVQIARNLERVRALPASPGERYVLVDTAGARLWMYEGGKPVDTMRVVVGKSEQQTPMMAGFLRSAIVNPYWNVPGDLVQARIATNVVSKGAGYLKNGGYQVLSDWSENPAVVDPGRIDWHAVAAGAEPPRVRQLPGKGNFMGKVKFMFPNELGIFLHDTPDKALLKEDARQFSSGCVRLEDAGRLGRWLLNKPLLAKAKSPEQRIELPEVVPVYITYLTAMPDKNGIAFRNDVYVRDVPTDKRGRTKLARADRP